MNLLAMRRGNDALVVGGSVLVGTMAMFCTVSSQLIIRSKFLHRAINSFLSPSRFSFLIGLQVRSLDRYLLEMRRRYMRLTLSFAHGKGRMRASDRM